MPEVKRQICSIVGVEEAKSVHEVARCIANMYAYGLAQTFYENVEQINLAIEKAIELKSKNAKS